MVRQAHHGFILRMVSPEVVKIELGITCIGAKMIGYKLLHRFLSSPLPFEIKLL